MTQSTRTAESDATESSAAEHLVVRWIFPQPPGEPTWLTTPRTTFGRDPACTVRLESEYVSRRHAAITRSGPLWIVSDLSSKNGVAVNGRPVREDVLSPGDVLRFGNFVAVAMKVPLGADLSSGFLAPEAHGGFRLRQAVDHMRQLACTDLPVVMEGETGTGKETFARALHAASGRSGPFRAVNCSVYSKTMAAAELFGYRRGAFTGAESASLGHVRAAQGGSLLLDELTDLSPDVQAMLLRVLENREVIPLGESKPVPIDVRFITATQMPLDAAVEAGILRSDLRARLEGGVISLPPLRESREVVLETFLALFDHHVHDRPKLRSSFAERLALHHWPLNLRELNTVVRRIAASYRPGNSLDRELLEAVLEPRPASAPRTPPRSAAQEVRRPREPSYPPDEVEALASALGRTQGNLTKAASALGLSRSKAYRMLRFVRDLKRQSVFAARASDGGANGKLRP